MFKDFEFIIFVLFIIRLLCWLEIDLNDFRFVRVDSDFTKIVL